MTREEAIKLLVNATYSDEWQGNEDLTTAHNMAIKALEQEPILDKIRAEIAEYGSIWVEYTITKDTKTDKGIEKLVSSVLKQAKEQVLQIIDKYKAESEEVCLNIVFVQNVAQKCHIELTLNIHITE